MISFPKQSSRVVNRTFPNWNRNIENANCNRAQNFKKTPNIRKGPRKFQYSFLKKLLKEIKFKHAEMDFHVTIPDSGSGGLSHGSE